MNKKRILFVILLVAALLFLLDSESYYQTTLAAVKVWSFGLLAAVCGFFGTIGAFGN